MSRITHHVVSNPKGGWSVVKGGSERASKTFGTRQEATSWGRTVSKNQNSDLVIHKVDGTVANRIVQKAEGNAPKGRG
jgi:hypothetical protein